MSSERSEHLVGYGLNPLHRQTCDIEGLCRVDRKTLHIAVSDEYNQELKLGKLADRVPKLRLQPRPKRGRVNAVLIGGILSCQMY